MKKPVVVGVVGGVASGKSEVTRHLERLGALVIHADTIGHQVLEEPAVIEALTRRFGEAIMDQPAYRIDRSKVAKLVFGTHPEAVENRSFLESIVHPRIRERIRESLNRALGQENLAMVVIDAPLLIESGWIDHCDRVLFVDTPIEIRRLRAQTRGWSDQQFSDRESAQVSIEAKQAAATDSIDNSGTLEALQQRVEQWFDRVT
jgi:dephospho-CoA kinase